MKNFRRKICLFREMLNIYCHRISSKIIKKRKEYLLFDPSLDSKNKGDSIIAYYCDKALKDIIDLHSAFRVQTHELPSKWILKEVPHYKNKIVCGTNLMTPHFEQYSIWKMPPGLYGYNNIITLGVGWEYYDSNISRTSKFIYRNILSTTGIHSVRDSYTEKMFHKMGIHNVINTGCPSLWQLSEEKCNNIPICKSSQVITTVTDYSRDPQNDRVMFNILLAHYSRVFVWLQGEGDIEYLQTIVDMTKIIVINNNLQDYTDILDNGNIDYVGTRLHAGIHAMNRGVRSIIIAIDNRTIEMGNDVLLPYICRKDIDKKLSQYIEKSFKTELKISWSNIAKWKRQFQEG